MGWSRLVSGLTSLRFSKLTWASVRRTGEGVGPGWSWEAVTAVGAHDGGLDRVAPAEVGEVVRFWAQFEEESPGFTTVWLVSAREDVWPALQLGPE